MCSMPVTLCPRQALLASPALPLVLEAPRSSPTLRTAGVGSLLPCFYVGPIDVYVTLCKKLVVVPEPKMLQVCLWGGGGRGLETTLWSVATGQAFWVLFPLSLSISVSGVSRPGLRTGGSKFWLGTRSWGPGQCGPRGTMVWDGAGRWLPVRLRPCPWPHQ